MVGNLHAGTTFQKHWYYGYYILEKGNDVFGGKECD